jgi:hypothetical protein
VKVVERPGPTPPKITVVTGTRHGGRFEAADTEWVSFRHADFEGVDLSGLRLMSLSVLDSRFTDCDFSGLRTGAVPMLWGGTADCFYVRCRFDKADLRRMTFARERFEGCSFRHAKMEDWDSTAEFIDCTFEGKMRQVQFWGHNPNPISARRKPPPRARNEFRGNDFRNAELWDVEFRGGIDLEAQLLPEGPEYIKLDRIMERARRARPAIEAWPAGEERRRALIMLDVFADPARHDDQPTLFANRGDLGSDRMWATLAAALPAA